jgi:hypothetical protein
VGCSVISNTYQIIGHSRFKHIFWIDVTSPEMVESSFIFIAKYCEAQAAGVENSMQSVSRWLSHNADPWLLVIDNPDNDPDIIAKCMPRGNHGNVLITSRNLGACCHSPEANIEVKEMEEEDAITLLLRLAFLSIDSEDLRHASRPIVKLFTAFLLLLTKLVH